MTSTPNVDFHLVSSGSGLEAQFVPTEFARDLDRRLQEAIASKDVSEMVVRSLRKALLSVKLERDRLEGVIHRARIAFCADEPDMVAAARMMAVLGEIAEEPKP